MASQRQKSARAVSRSEYCRRAHVAWLTKSGAKQAAVLEQSGELLHSDRLLLG